MRRFAWASIALTISLAIAPTKDFFSQWRQYQRHYRRLLRQRPDSAELRRRFTGGIQQIWIPQQGVVDRCTTCHVALKEPALQNVSTHPYRPHPPIPHSLTEFGCVMCHRGQGPATTVEEAHHSTKAWEEPILPAKYLESSCGQCHLSALEGTPRLNSGRQLLAGYGCIRCHSAVQPDGTSLVPTDDPPSLEHIADKTTREWLFAFLKNPYAYSSISTMPNFLLSDDQARDISAYLIAQSVALPTANGEKSNQRQETQPLNAAQSQAGASLYGESFCASCHATQTAAGALVGGDFGPELTRIGNKAKPEWLKEWLQNPFAYDPDTRMPHYRFNQQQINLLASFLEAKTDSYFLANIHLSEATPEQITHGKRLVAELGCAVCHEINGARKPSNFAPDLSLIGSKVLSEIVFAPGMTHTLPDYISGKMQRPRAFGPGLKMPQYNFTAQQTDALTTALLALNDRARLVPASLRIPGPRQSQYEPAGEAGKLVRDLRCMSCHVLNGRGGDMAPDLSWEGSTVRSKWLSDFMKNPQTLRPALIRRMPKFNLTEHEIATLTDYIMTVYQNPAIDRHQAIQGVGDAATVAHGHELFYTKYACQSCHIADTKKDKGYIGPGLSAAGEWLTPAWTYHWLKDPQALQPGTLEPNQHIPDDDARALTAFLMSLRSDGGRAGRKK